MYINLRISSFNYALYYYALFQNFATPLFKFQLCHCIISIFFLNAIISSELCDRRQNLFICVKP